MLGRLSISAWAALAACAASHAPPIPCARHGDCVDDDPCTTDGRCDSASSTCTFRETDDDGDGLVPVACGGGDCDDARDGALCGPGGPTPDAVDYCRQRAYRVCVRDRSRGVIPDDTELTACIDAIDGACAGAAWPAGCSPTAEEANACLDALLDATMLALDDSAIPACMLCP
jgi:hypothetical protein